MLHMSPVHQALTLHRWVGVQLLLGVYQKITPNLEECLSSVKKSMLQLLSLSIRE